jgi:hypothetical protein
VFLAASMSGCTARKSEPPQAQAPPPRDEFKIGIMTGTASQGAEDFRAGEQVERRYPGRVLHITYPDNFPSETETVVAQLVGLAADPRVRVILVGQAIPGSVTAARRIRQQRPDILIGFVGPHEDPDVVNGACDLAIEPDEHARGTAIVEAARKMGARNFVHYSFPRHLSQQFIAERRDIMKKACARHGMRFFSVEAPDPAGDDGLGAGQRFISEDVPRRLDSLGPATAFYSTSDGLQAPLIKAILAAAAGYFVEQDVPAPSQGYPEALGISIPSDKEDSLAWIHAENRRAIAAKRMSGHFGTWEQPVDMVAIRAGARLLVDAADKKADLRDSATVRRYLEAEAGVPLRLRRYDPKGNQWLILMDHVTY